jgi:hypothetical protein
LKKNKKVNLKKDIFIFFFFFFFFFIFASKKSRMGRKKRRDPEATQTNSPLVEEEATHK